MGSMFTITVREGDDTIHRLHPYEACNTDDADDVDKIDELTAMRMLATGIAKACEHCKPMTDG